MVEAEKFQAARKFPLIERSDSGHWNGGEEEKGAREGISPNGSQLSRLWWWWWFSR